MNFCGKDDPQCISTQTVKKSIQNGWQSKKKKKKLIEKGPFYPTVYSCALCFMFM